MTMLETEPAATPRSTRDQLTEAGLALANDYRSVPAGSVLRCFSRAVRVARRSGTDPRALPHVARDTADMMLQSRGATRTQGDAR